MPAPIPDDKRAAILEAIKAGDRSRAAIAREFEVSPDSVSRIAKAAGIVDPFARTMTKKATEAAQADNTARRTRLKANLLALAEEGIEQARAELADAKAKDAALVVGIALDKLRALEHDDTDTQNLNAVDAWLDHITGGEE